MLQTILFYAFSAGAVAFGVGVVASRSPVYGVLFLVAAMGMMAGLFVLLQAFLVAMILVLVYAGALLVLFLFVVMLVDVRKLNAAPSGKKAPLAIAASVLLFIPAMSVIRTVSLPKTQTAQGTAEAVGRLLFTRYVLPFELTSILLLAAILSVVVLAKRETK